MRHVRVWCSVLFCWAVLAVACADKETETQKVVQEATDEAAGTVLDLWAGVPPLQPEDDDIAKTLEPKPGPPKPKTIQEVVEVPFRAEKSTKAAPPTAAGPLKVLRFGPEGPQAVIDAIRVSFNQPMVPLASVEALRAKKVPLEIDPQPPGKVRWLGTDTVAFMADGRVPFSTTYKVTVPKGVESTTGATLDEAVTWEITTPVLALQSIEPAELSTDVPLDPTISMTFNQPVQRVPLLAALSFKGGGKAVELEEVPVAEPDAMSDRVVQLKPKAELQPDTKYTLTIPAGVFGEGPDKSPAISRSFTTYPPLKLRLEPCGKPCYASSGITLSATTQIQDPGLPEKVTVTPKPENLSIGSSYYGIHISGDFEGLATYKVEVDAEVTDMHGQKLGKPFKASRKMGPLHPSLSVIVAHKNPGVLEKGSTPVLPVRATGFKEMEVFARALSPDELPQHLDNYWHDYQWPTEYGPHTYNQKFDISDSLKVKKKLDLDLASMLDGKKNFVRIFARSNEYKESWSPEPRRQFFFHTVQVTDLGIAAAFDNDSGIVMVNRLSDNTPVPAARVKMIDRDKSVLWEGITDTLGMARVSYAAPRYGVNYLLAETDDDAAFMMLNQSDARGQWFNTYRQDDQPRPFFFTDRTPYKPGDTIHLVGILRNETKGPQGGVKIWRGGTKATWVVNNPRGIEVAKGDVDITDLGTLTVDIPTKEEHGTGNYSFQLTVPNLFSANQTFYHGIPVETYRAPEFEVKVERPDSTPLVYGDKLVAEVRASYLHGAPLIGGAVTWSLQRSDSGFTPPGELNDGFSFGDGHFGYGRGRHYWGHWTPPARPIKTGDGETDTKGVLAVDHELLAVDPKPEKEPETKPEGPPRASTYTLSATVTDENRQAIGSSGSFVVHAATNYVGIRTDRTVLREGQQVNVEAVVVDLDGERTPDRPVSISVLRRVTERKAEEKEGVWTYTYETKEESAGSCDLESRGVPVSCDVKVGKAGTYVVRGEAEDEKGRPTRTETQIYVHGEDAVIWDQEDRRIDIVPDKKKYEPGQTANLLLRSPFDDAWGLVVVEREGISREFAVSVHGGATAVEVPVTEEMAPGVTVSAMLFRGRVEIPGAPEGQDLGMPAVAAGTVKLDVSTKEHEIKVGLEAPKEIAPKGTIELKIKTTDGNDKPLAASLAVMVVDEGVLSLMGYQTPDPLSFFIHERPGQVWMQALHANVMERQDPSKLSVIGTTPEADEGEIGLGNVGLIGKGGGGGTGSGYGRGVEQEEAQDDAPASAAEPAPAPPAERKAKESAKNGDKKMDRRAARAPARPAPGRATTGGFDVASAMGQSVSLRTMFATTAYFNGDVHTDANGDATVTIEMPENLTTFRVMAVAIDPGKEDRFGSGETPVRVRKPVMLRPALPRFANFGDTFEAGVMVDNQTGKDQKVLVGTRGLNVGIGSEDQKFIDIPAGESREVRFDLSTKEVGKMRLQFAAMCNDGRDATEIEIPVNYPATAQAFATYGMTDSSTERLVEPPKDALEAFGGLELSFSSTALSGLEDAVQYLVDYEYECAEQTASRILPIFVLGDVLDQFPIASVRDKVYRELLGRDGIRKLFDKQNYDGGFTYWGDRESWPYLTNWVTFALLEGKRSGFEVDQGKLDNAMRYIENFVRHGYKTRWGDYYDWTSRSFGLWLLSREKKGDDLFEKVWAHRDDVPLYARAQLMSAAHAYGKTAERDQILEELRKVVTETARTIHFAESTSEASMEGLRVLMHSNVQTDAIAMMALLEVVPEDSMLPKVMAGIMSSRDPRRSGRWGTTHANAWALLSAARYFETVEKETPDFTTQVWLDDEFGGELQFKGRSMAKQQQRVPMAQLLGEEMRKLVVAKEGPGKLYYRMGLRYAPADLKLEAEDQGFAVFRTYEAIPEPGEEKPDPEAVVLGDDGSWKVKAGTNIKVTINLVVRDRANYVVVDDGLPAGFEGQNPRFKTSVAATGSGTVSYGTETSRWWYPWWSFSHTDLRDDRMLLFADYLPAGVYTYSYTARATTIGSFQLPPIKAEAMYEPELFGHSSSSTVTVVE